MCSARDNVALPTLGFPIRASAGHWPFSASPRLIAAVHALHRLLVPRHPPCALTILTGDWGKSLSDLPLGVCFANSWLGYLAVTSPAVDKANSSRYPETVRKERPPPLKFRMKNQ